MNDASAASAVLIGLAVRLVIPILITLLVVTVLLRLDRRWQSEADAHPIRVEKPECWKVRHCTAEQRRACSAYASALPCWQVFRRNDGYLQQKCLACPVFVSAPIPSRASS